MGSNFSLFSDLDGYVSAFETGVSKSSLASGYVSNFVPNGTTTVRVKSTDGSCLNTYVDLSISGLPAVTPTPTVTTTQQVILTTPTVTPTKTSIVTPFTITYDVGGAGGGQLIVKSAQNVELVNKTSTAGSTQSGTIQLTLSQVPVTIIARWVAGGSGDPVKMRVCDIYSGGSELYYVDDLCPSCLSGISEATFTTSSGTPYDMQISLVKGINNAPAICAS